MDDKKYEFTVCTRCFTYNHALFIEKALEGFVMQQSSFPMVFTVVDDCSIDNEQDVVKKWVEANLDFEESNYAYQKRMSYGELLFARHKVNRNASFAILFLNENHYQLKKDKMGYISEWLNNAKYIALCEGDDYWIYPKKLQIQIDFLENHPNHSACIHAHRREDYFANGVMLTDCYKYPDNLEIIPANDVICNKSMFCATASWVYRSEAVVDYPEWAKQAPVGDKPLKLILFARGHIGYINELMSVYRVGVPGSWTKRVLKNRKAEIKLRKGLVNIMKDFDQWTERKYHQYVRRNIAYYHYTYWKTDYIIRPYLKMKKLLNSKQ